jgi:hypothetical protein
MDRRRLLGVGVALLLTALAPTGRVLADEVRMAILPLGTLSVPVIHPGQAPAQLAISPQLELAHAGLSNHARRNMTRLVNDLLVDLADVAARTPASAPGPDAERIRRRIFAVSTRVLGPGSVKAVYLEGHSVHRPN